MYGAIYIYILRVNIVIYIDDLLRDFIAYLPRSPGIYITAEFACVGDGDASKVSK